MRAMGNGSIGHFCVLLLTAICFTIVLNGTTRAQGDVDGSCNMLDIVVLLDQSSSMSLTDPQNMRIDSVRTLIATLYDHAAYTCPGVLFRIGVIGFGSDAQTLIDLNSSEGQIQVLPGEQRQAWTTRRDAAASLVIAENRQSSSYRPALELADTMLAAAPPDSGQGTRIRIVMLLVDSTPCPEKAVGLVLPGGGNLCTNPSWIEHYFSANNPMFNAYNGEKHLSGGFDFEYGLSNFLLASEALSGETQLNVVFFTNARNVSAYPQVVDTIWTTLTAAHNGTYISPARINGDLRQIAVGLDQILAPYLNGDRTLVLFQKDETGCTGNFILEPYLDSAILVNILRNADGSYPELQNPDGAMVDSSSEIPAEMASSVSLLDLPNDGLTRQLALNNAPTGQWTLHAIGDCDRADAQVFVLPLNMQTQASTQVTAQPSLPYNVKPDDDILITMTNSFGVPVSKIDDKMLNICGTVTTSSPTASRVLKLIGCYRFLNEEPGVWRSTLPLPAPTAGTYLMRITGTTPSLDPAQMGTPLQVFTADITYVATGER